MTENQADRICRHYHVFGRVQGVWFRSSTRERARQLGLSGWVRNCEDGSVEAVACGSAQALDAFKSWLWQGPSAARVDEVEETGATDPPADDNFHVRD